MKVRVTYINGIRTGEQECQEQAEIISNMFAVPCYYLWNKTAVLTRSFMHALHMQHTERYQFVARMSINSWKQECPHSAMTSTSILDENSVLQITYRFCTHWYAKPVDQRAQIGLSMLLSDTDFVLVNGHRVLFSIFRRLQGKRCFLRTQTRSGNWLRIWHSTSTT